MEVSIVIHCRLDGSGFKTYSGKIFSLLHTLPEQLRAHPASSKMDTAALAHG